MTIVTVVTLVTLVAHKTAIVVAYVGSVVSQADPITHDGRGELQCNLHFTPFIYIYIYFYCLHYNLMILKTVTCYLDYHSIFVGEERLKWKSL